MSLKKIESIFLKMISSDEIMEKALKSPSEFIKTYMYDAAEETKEKVIQSISNIQHLSIELCENTIKEIAKGFHIYDMTDVSFHGKK